MKGRLGVSEPTRGAAQPALRGPARLGPMTAPGRPSRCSTGPPAGGAQGRPGWSEPILGRLVEADRGGVAALAPSSRLVVVAAAIGGALAGCHPTGTPALDSIYAALFAAAVTWAGARAPRGTLLWLGVLAVAMSRSWLLVPALAALLLAFAGVWPRRPNPLLGALSGARRRAGRVALARGGLSRGHRAGGRGGHRTVPGGGRAHPVGTGPAPGAPVDHRPDRAGHCSLHPGRRDRPAGPFRNQPGDRHVRGRPGVDRQRHDRVRARRSSSRRAPTSHPPRPARTAGGPPGPAWCRWCPSSARPWARPRPWRAT